MPAASRSQSSHAQPCRYASGPRNSDASADAAGDHDVGALRERIGDRPRAEIRGSEQRGARASRANGSAVSRCAKVVPGCLHVVEATEQIVADHGRDRDTADAEFLRSCDRGPRRAGGVDAAGVGDDLGAAVGDVRQRARASRQASRACSPRASSRWRSFWRIASVNSASASRHKKSTPSARSASVAAGVSP